MNLIKSLLCEALLSIHSLSIFLSRSEVGISSDPGAGATSWMYPLTCANTW
ncbi:hypothetical protein PF003_g35348 [Phytophthora fragariae]|nr:hypothetical protein PF003_g35348 [Phytophthora fragariae]